MCIAGTPRSTNQDHTVPAKAGHCSLEMFLANMGTRRRFKNSSSKEAMLEVKAKGASSKILTGQSPCPLMHSTEDYGYDSDYCFSDFSLL